MSVGYTDIARGGHPPRSARGTQPRPPPPVSLKQRTGRAATLRQPLPRQARPGAGCHDKHFLPLAPQPPPPSLWPPAGAPPTAGTGRRAGECGTVAGGGGGSFPGCPLGWGGRRRRCCLRGSVGGGGAARGRSARLSPSITPQLLRGRLLEREGGRRLGGRHGAGAAGGRERGGLGVLFPSEFGERGGHAHHPDLSGSRRAEWFGGGRDTPGLCELGGGSVRRGERSGCNRRPPLVAALGERGSSGGAARRSRVAEQRGGGGGGRRAQRVDAAGGKGRAARAAGLGGSALRQSGSSAGRYRRGGSPSARGRSRSPPAAAPGGAGAAGTARTAGPHGPPLPGRSGCGRGGSGGRDNGLLSSYLRRPEGGGGCSACRPVCASGRGGGTSLHSRPQTGAALPVTACVGCAATAAALDVSAETHLNR